MRYAIALLASVLSAGVMTFEPSPTGSGLTSPITEDGIVMSVTAGAYDLTNNCSGHCIQTGAGTTFHFELDGGGLFDLTAISLFSDGATFSSSKGSLPASSLNGVPPLSVPEFQGISFFDVFVTLDFAFDNVTLAPASVVTPEPGTLVLFGIAVLAAAARRLNLR